MTAMTFHAGISNLAAPGDWCLCENGKTLLVWLPKGGICSVNIDTDPNAPHPRWSWNGSIEAPTLTPSLNLVGVWHGHIVGGMLKEC